MSAADIGGLQTFPAELQDRAAWLEPFEWYAEMRERAPVRYDPDRRTWDVFRYDHVKEILANDDGRFSTSPRNIDGFEEPPEDEGFLLDTMLLQDPPRHDELRSVVDDAFEPRAIRELEPRIRTLTSELLDEALAGADGELDLVDAIAYPLPVIVIADLLGIPREDRDRFKRWSDTIVRGADSGVDPESFVEEQRQAGQEMAMYFLQQLEDRRQNPKDDLLTTIATAEGEGGKLSHREALGMCMLLLIAGNITTTHLITNAVRCFDAHDGDLFDSLADGARELTSAIEEVLRYRAPVQAMTRVPLEDVEIGGETLEAGDGVVVWLGSANRDERQFANADSFVPGRSPNSHLGFGHGRHYCLGAPLARLEANVVLDELTDRISAVEVADADLTPVRSSFIYGVESLPIRFENSASW
ncbi:monooxygenase YjiB [Halolamina litorea]|uniref:Cytochrome P450 n=1 Tax=Halolamina litorea TaxID=1515593 RepID=A0ABD6BTM2_9EURY|nr:cytochrome P450 [Halolamina litorea]